MYETIEENTFKKSKISFCFACLSSDRNLISIDEYMDIITSLINNSTKVSQEARLCWECSALLKKIKYFKCRLEEAQRILSCQLTHTQKTLITGLSRLSMVSIKPENVVIITHDDEMINKQFVSTIKQEINNLDDELNDDVSSNHDVEEIKKESKLTLKTKVSNSKSKRSHYRLVYGPNIRKKSLLRKKFAIKMEAVPQWLQRDKDSKFYKTCRFQCTVCFEGYNCKDKLERHHLKCHHESLGPHICPTCRARFATPASLDAHTQAHMFAWCCARCDFKCYTLRRLNAHIIRTHKLVQCVYCDVCLSTVRLFRKHYREMHRVFLCDHCGKRYKTKYMLEKHMSAHTSQHKCSWCGRQYASRSALSKHRATKHGARAPEEAYCVRCDKQFDSAPVYRRHLLNATAHAHETNQRAKKKVPCPECGNAYSRRAYMMNHYRHVHMNQSKHYCSHCDRHFLNRTRFVDHMRFNHEGVKREKNKLCNVCGRGFATNRILANHIRTHSGERPFECEHCSAKFTQKHSMLSHVKYIHLKSKRPASWQPNNLQ